MSCRRSGDDADKSVVLREERNVCVCVVCACVCVCCVCVCGVCVYGVCGVCVSVVCVCVCVNVLLVFLFDANK